MLFIQRYLFHIHTHMFNIHTAKTIGMPASRAQCKSPARSGMLHTHQIE